VDLGSAGCIHDIAKATADIKVQIVFCNAGYIMKGFFYARYGAAGTHGDRPGAAAPLLRLRYLTMSAAKVPVLYWRHSRVRSDNTLISNSYSSSIWYECCLFLVSLPQHAQPNRHTTPSPNCLTGHACMMMSNNACFPSSAEPTICPAGLLRRSARTLNAMHSVPWTSHTTS